MSPHHADERVTLWHGDALEVLRSLPDASVDSVVTDPPYGLEFMGKDWDAPWKPSSVGRGVRVEAERSDEMTTTGKGHTTSAGPYLAARVDSTRVVEAAIVEGFHCIAIEREADYLPLIMQRINRRLDPVAAIKQTGDDLGLFDLEGEGA